MAHTVDGVLASQVQPPASHKTKHSGTACNASTQEDQNFRNILSYTVNSRLAWAA